MFSFLTMSPHKPRYDFTKDKETFAQQSGHGRTFFFSLVSILPLLDEIRFICAEVLQLNHRWESAQTFWRAVQMAV